MEETARNCSKMIRSVRQVSDITKCYGFYSDGRNALGGVLKKFSYLEDEDFVDCVLQFPNGSDSSDEIIEFFKLRNEERKRQAEGCDDEAAVETE